VSSRRGHRIFWRRRLVLCRRFGTLRLLIGALGSMGWKRSLWTKWGNGRFRPCLVRRAWLPLSLRLVVPALVGGGKPRVLRRTPKTSLGGEYGGLRIGAEAQERARLFRLGDARPLRFACHFSGACVPEPVSLSWGVDRRGQVGYSIRRAPLLRLVVGLTGAAPL